MSSDDPRLRGQYHVRRVNGQLYAWDIGKMVARTRNLASKEVRLSDIAEVDEPYWAEEGPPMTGRVVLEHLQIMRTASLDYPIILCPEGRIIDGMHRVLKAIDLGHDTIAAYRLPEMPPPDYIDIPLADLPH